MVDFVTTGVDVFEVRVRELEVAGIDLQFLTKFVLESMKTRLDSALKGICTFKYVGEEGDHSRALEVTVEPKALVPAFPDLHLVDVDVRVVSATNRDLRDAIAKGQFREELFYRVNVIAIHLPALRERAGDVRLLAHTLSHRARRVTRDAAGPGH